MITITQIEIGKSVEALHEWNKLALTVTVPPGEDPQKVFFEAKSLLDKLLPGVDKGEDRVSQPPVNNRISALIEDINGCTEIDKINPFGGQIGLLAFKDLADSNPEIKAAYDLRLKQLQK